MSALRQSSKTSSRSQMLKKTDFMQHGAGKAVEIRFSYSHIKVDASSRLTRTIQERFLFLTLYRFNSNDWVLVILLNCHCWNSNTIYRKSNRSWQKVYRQRLLLIPCLPLYTSCIKWLKWLNDKMLSVASLFCTLLTQPNNTPVISLMVIMVDVVCGTADLF